MDYPKIQELGRLEDLTSLELIEPEELDFDPMKLSDEDMQEISRIRQYLDEQRQIYDEACDEYKDELDPRIYECEITPINAEYERFIEEMHREHSDDFTFDWDEEFYTKVRDKRDKFEVPDPEDLGDLS